MPSSASRCPSTIPVYKVTIIPRGRALGVTQFLPEQDRYSMSKRRIESAIATLFGGRIAEEIIFGADAVTTGASNDIERATDLARNMVTRWGLSNRLGPLTYSEESGEVFLGPQRHAAQAGVGCHRPRDRRRSAARDRDQLHPRSCSTRSTTGSRPSRSNRPDRLNAYTQVMAGELREALCRRPTPTTACAPSC